MLQRLSQMCSPVLVTRNQAATVNAAAADRGSPTPRHAFRRLDSADSAQSLTPGSRFDSFGTPPVQGERVPLYLMISQPSNSPALLCSSRPDVLEPSAFQSIHNRLHECKGLHLQALGAEYRGKAFLPTCMLPAVGKVRLMASAGVETTAQLWTEDRRALEVDIHKEKTRDHENWEPDLLSQVARILGPVWGACPRVHACAAIHAEHLCIPAVPGRVHVLMTVVPSGSYVAFAYFAGW